MTGFLNYLLYLVILIKILFIISILRYNSLLVTGNLNKNLEKKIKARKEVLHESFVFFMYLILIILFRPTNKFVRLHENRHNSYHLQIVIFALGVIQLVNFNYNLIFQAPKTIYNIILSNDQ